MAFKNASQVAASEFEDGHISIDVYVVRVMKGWHYALSQFAIISFRFDLKD